MLTLIFLLLDNKISLRLLVNFVRKANHTYEQAETGQEALDAVKATSRDSDGSVDSIRPFDFVLMDIAMPMMNGIDATKSIRELEQQRSWPHMLIVALTAWDDAHTRREAAAAGMDIFMPKPVKFLNLRNLLERLAEGRNVAST